MQSESLAAAADPATHAIELAHALAFRSGLGSSLFASPHNSVTTEEIKSFASSVFGKGNIAVLGTGIDQSTLSKLVEKAFGPSPSSPPTPTSSSSSYFGGETRVEAHGGPQTIFIGFGKTGTPLPELAALSAHLSPQSSVKWSQGLSPISAGTPLGTSVHTIFLPYSDATLFGLLVQGTTTAGVKEAGKVAVKALKDSASLGGIKADDLKKAIAKAKFAAASALDSRDGVVSVLGAKASLFKFEVDSSNLAIGIYPQVLGGLEASLDGTLASLDGITAPAFSKVIDISIASAHT
jgi:ubiquinol-cytochrome c reductase core subunit 2